MRRLDRRDVLNFLRAGRDMPLSDGLAREGGVGQCARCGLLQRVADACRGCAHAKVLDIVAPVRLYVRPRTPYFRKV